MVWNNDNYYTTESRIDPSIASRYDIVADRFRKNGFIMFSDLLPCLGSGWILARLREEFPNLKLVFTNE